MTYTISSVQLLTGLGVEQLSQEPRSFRVLWDPPASLADLTGYHIYYSGAGDSGSVDVGASATELTIGNRTADVTYTITIVALSPHLPSPVIGPVNFTLGGYFTTLSTLQINMYVNAIISDRFRKVYTK